LVYSWSVIFWLWVVWGWLVNRGVIWGGVNNRFVDNWGNVWCWLVDNWGMVWSWFVDWSWVVYWSWFVSWSWVIHWSGLMDWGWVVDWSWVVGSGVMYWGVVWSTMINWGVNWDMGRGMYGCSVLFAGIRVVYILRSSMGLAGYHGVVTTMGLVDRVAHSRGVAMLDDLMAGLVSQSNCQKARDCDKSLKDNFLLVS